MTKISRLFNIVIDKIGPTKDKWSKKTLLKKLIKNYDSIHNRTFDLKNPTLFTEKLQLYKVCYKHSNLNRAVDKYEFKNLIREQLGEGYTIKCYGVYSTIKGLKNAWNSLPKTFVLYKVMEIL